MWIGHFLFSLIQLTSYTVLCFYTIFAHWLNIRFKNTAIKLSLCNKIVYLLFDYLKNIMYSKISTVIAIYNDKFFLGGGSDEGVINGP